MKDDLIVLAILSAVFFVFFFVQKRMGRFVFERLISDREKDRLSSYYKFKFFPIIIKGIIAGLCMGPLYTIPVYIISIINNDIQDLCLGLQILLYILGFPLCVIIYSILCTLYGILFAVFENLLLTVVRAIANSDPDSKDAQILSPDQFVWTLFGTLGISQLFPNTSILICLMLSGVLVLGVKIWKLFFGYWLSKGTKRIWHKIQKLNSALVFSVSIFCVFVSCANSNSIDFAMFGNRMLRYGPLLLFFSFFDELSRISFVKKVEAFMTGLLLDFLNVDVKTPFSSIGIIVFSSALSFVLTFVLTNNIMLSLVAIVIAIISVKKPKYEWVYAIFGIVVSFILFTDFNPDQNPSFKYLILVFAIPVLYALMFLIIKFLRLIACEDIDLKILEDFLYGEGQNSLDPSSDVKQ